MEFDLNRLIGSTIVLLILCGLSGCQPTAESAKSVEAPTSKPVAELKLLVVDDERFGQEIKRRWESEGNRPLQLSSISEGDFRSARFEMAPDIDAIVYPSGLVGDLELADELFPIDLSAFDMAVMNRESFLGHFRHQYLSGISIRAIPLGGPTWSLIVRVDKVPVFPETWEDLTQWIESVPSDAGSVIPFVEPTEGIWAAQTLLVHSASRIRTPGVLSTVFEVETLKPTINSEPFLRSLNEMITVYQRSGSVKRTPEQCLDAVQSGQALVALGFPASGNEPSEVRPVPSSGSSSEPFSMGRVPGSRTWYDQSEKRWVARESNDQIHLDYLAFGGRVVSVSNNSTHANDAIRFANWLSSNQVMLKLAGESQDPGPSRVSHLEALRSWTGESLSDTNLNQYADVIRTAHQDRLSLIFPQVARQKEYLEALAVGVQKALDGQVPPQQALDEVADHWNKITQDVGESPQQRLLKLSDGK